MRTILATFLFVIFPNTPLVGQETPKRGENPFAFIHVTIIDATGAPAKPDMTVLVVGDRIAAIGKTGKVKIPKGTQKIDSKGKFLIPGLWDMHTHTLRQERRDFFLPLFIANGVTGIRDMGAGDLGLRDKWRDEVASGVLIGPRIVGTGPVVDGPLPMIPGSISAKDEGAGRQAVATTRRNGADFVKVYSLLPRDIYLAIADEAKKQGVPFVGHVSEYISATEASDAGQKSMEHLFGVLISCSTRETELRKKIIEALNTRDRRAFSVARRQAYADAVDSYSDDKARELFKRLVVNQTWQVPTLTYFRGVAFADDPEFIKDGRLKYLPPSFTSEWTPRPGTRSADDTDSLKKVLRKHMQIVGQMRRAGVRILAGTDTLAAFCLPGFGLHDEMSLLVEAGLTPMEALQAATFNPAVFLGRLDLLGTIHKNKLADLILLDENPLKDINNTRKINTVVANGRLLDRKALDELLAQTEAKASKR